MVTNNQMQDLKFVARYLESNISDYLSQFGKNVVVRDIVLTGSHAYAMDINGRKTDFRKAGKKVKKPRSAEKLDSSDFDILVIIDGEKQWDSKERFQANKKVSHLAMSQKNLGVLMNVFLVYKDEIVDDWVLDGASRIGVSLLDNTEYIQKKDITQKYA